jgi:hypothetical protein
LIEIGPRGILQSLIGLTLYLLDYLVLNGTSSVVDNDDVALSFLPTPLSRKHHPGGQNSPFSEQDRLD